MPSKRAFSDVLKVNVHERPQSGLCNTVGNRIFRHTFTSKALFPISLRYEVYGFKEASKQDKAVDS